MIDSNRLKLGLRAIANAKGHWFNWASDEGQDEILGQCSRCQAMWHFLPTTVSEADVVTGVSAIVDGPDCQNIRLYREALYGSNDKTLISCVAIGVNALNHVTGTDSPLRAPDVRPSE